jgi:hypothetical protein
MSSRDRPTAGWTDGDLPGNVQLGRESCIFGPDAFKRFFSKRDVALLLGDRSRTDGVKFAIGPQGYVAIGHDCYLNDCILLAEQEIKIGNYVMSKSALPTRAHRRQRVHWSRMHHSQGCHDRRWRIC